MVVNLLKTIKKEKVNAELDKMYWKWGKGDLFSVKEAYKVLQPRRDIIFLVEGVWISCAPTKTTFFTLEAVWGKVLTLDKLRRRGWQLSNRCL